MFYYLTEISGKFELLRPTLSVKVKRIDDMNSLALENVKIPNTGTLKRKARDTQDGGSRKRMRPENICSESYSQDGVSRVISDENSTSVERYSVSGQKLKIVCYRKFNDGEVDRNGHVTSLSPRSKTSSPVSKPTESESPLPSPSTKSDRNEKVPSLSSNSKLYYSPQAKSTKTATAGQSKSTKCDTPTQSKPPKLSMLQQYEPCKTQTVPQSRSSKLETAAPKNSTKSREEKVKLDNIKKIGKSRSLKNNDINDLLGDDSETEESSSSSDGEEEEEAKLERSDSAAVKGTVQGRDDDDVEEIPLPGSAVSKVVKVNKQSTKKADSHEDKLKNLPLPGFITPKKDKYEEPKSKSTIKKRFTCEECSESFTTQAELKAHEEDHDFQPVSKTPSR